MLSTRPEIKEQRIKRGGGVGWGDWGEEVGRGALDKGRARGAREGRLFRGRLVLGIGGRVVSDGLV